MFKNKKIVALISIIVILTLGILIYFLCRPNNDFENKLFISENSELFFLEQWEPLDVTKTDEWKTTAILYIDKEYVYMFGTTNSEEATGLISEYKGKYTLDKEKITFSFDEIGEYTASLTKNGTLSLKLVSANDNYFEQFVGNIDHYNILKDYEYDKLKEIYTINLEKSLKNHKDKLCKKIGGIIGTSPYNKAFNNNNFGFQYNPDNPDHPFFIIEKGKKIDNLVLSSIKKVSNTMWTISLSENKNDTNKVFALVLDTSKNEITAEFKRIKVKTNEPMYNGSGIYEKALTITYPINKTNNSINNSSNSNSGINNSSNTAHNSNNKCEKDQILIKDYTGKNYKEIKALLEKYGINVIVETTTSSNPKNSIVKQSKPSGTCLGEKDTITLKIPEVTTLYPDFTNGSYTLKDIENFANKNNLKLIIKMQQSDHPSGTILSQSKKSGTKVTTNSALEITVAE